MKAKAPRPLTDLMRSVMADIAAGRGGFYGCDGRSEHGGRTGTLAGLGARGLIDHHQELTAAGHEWIAQEQARRRRPEADWSQAPEGTTHVMRAPGNEHVSWIKIVGPAEVYWRWPHNKNWRPSTGGSAVLLRSPNIEPRPSPPQAA